MGVGSDKLMIGFVLVFVISIILPAVQGQEGFAPAPAPAPAPTSDGTTIDQGIACVLMLLALAVTYLVHAADVQYN